jgi:hypothetical protein
MFDFYLPLALAALGTLPLGHQLFNLMDEYR